jgi:hypothetical protein
LGFELGEHSIVINLLALIATMAEISLTGRLMAITTKAPIKGFIFDLNLIYR